MIGGTLEVAGYAPAQFVAGYQSLLTDGITPRRPALRNVSEADRNADELTASGGSLKRPTEPTDPA